MRRLISIALVVLMLLSVATVGVFTVSAEEAGSEIPSDAEAINDANDFAFMESNGTYYLNADITVDSTYSSFSGTLYGNGHKVTINAPLFNTLSGATVKDLVLEGEINDEATVAGYIGALANIAGDSVIDGVVSNVNVTTTISHVAGIVGYGRGASDILIQNCVNNGKISSGTKTTSAGLAAGIIATSEADNTTILNCTNTAEVKSDREGAGNATDAGGIVAKVLCSTGVLTIKGCVNTGNVSGNRTGGILGAAEDIRSTMLEECVNTGDVQSPYNYCGGVVGRIDARGPAYYRACVNTGTVTIKKSQAGGILGYSGNSNEATGMHHFYACVNTGTITGFDLESTTESINCGGLVGVISGAGELYSCVNTGAISANSAAGGLSAKLGLGAGDLNGMSGSIINNCYSAGNVFSYNKYGGRTCSTAGLSGYIWGAGNCSKNVITGNVTSAATAEADIANKIMAAGLVGYSNNGGGRYDDNYILGVLDGGAQAVEVALFNAVNATAWKDNVHLTSGNYTVGDYPLIYDAVNGATPYGANKANAADFDTDEEILATLNGLVDYAAFTVAPENEYGITGIVPTAVANMLAGKSETEAVAVGTAEEFLAMSATGNYYLTADITLDETYAGVFSGTLDGKGFTVTVSVPAFNMISGATVTDIVFEGEIERENKLLMNTRSINDYAGSLAAIATNVTISKIVNNADVAAFEDAGGVIGRAYGVVATDCVNNGVIRATTAAGGIVGRNLEADATFENCVNNGTFSKYNYSAGAYAGIIGRIDFCDMVATNCVNNATIDVPFAASRGAGIIAYAYNSNRVQRANKDANGKDQSDLERALLTGVVTLNNCVNNANVIAYDQTGGLIGWSEGITYVNDSVNYGNITSVQNYAGGIIARAGANDGQDFNGPHTFTNCVNNGKVTTHRQYAGGIVGYSQDNLTFESCVNNGDVTGDDINVLKKCSDRGCHTGGNWNIYCVGGMVGRVDYDIKAYNCVNNGDLSGNRAVGGMAGEVAIAYAKGIDGKYIIDNCLNTGDIYNTVLEGKADAKYMYGTGGLIGTSYSDFNVPTSGLYITESGSVGTVKIGSAGTVVCGLVGYTDSLNTTVKNSFFGGTLVSDNADAEFYAIVKCEKTPVKEIADNFIIKNYACLYEDSTGVVTVKGNYEGYFAAADVASGKLCYELNEALGSNVFYQQLGVDVAPVPFAGEEEWIVYYDEATNTYLNEEPEEETTEAPTTEAPTTEEPTTEAPTTEAPTTEEPTTEEPTTDEPTTDAPTTDAPTTDAPTTDAPTTDAPTTDAGTTEKPDDSQSGCGSVIGAAAVLVAVALIAPAAIMLKKDEE